MDGCMKYRNIRVTWVKTIRGGYKPVSTAPTSIKRKPNAGRAIWQFAAITTPATIRPPSIFSTLKRDIGVGHFNFAPSPPLSAPSSAAMVLGL